MRRLRDGGLLRPRARSGPARRRRQSNGGGGRARGDRGHPRARRGDAAAPRSVAQLSMVLSIADLAARTDQWGTLGKLVEKPDFVGRWMSVHPDAAAAGLLLDQAMAAIEGQAVAPERDGAGGGEPSAPLRDVQGAGAGGDLRARRGAASAARGAHGRAAAEGRKRPWKKPLASMAAPPEGRGKRLLNRRRPRRSAIGPPLGVEDRAGQGGLDDAGRFAGSTCDLSALHGQSFCPPDARYAFVLAARFPPSVSGSVTPPAPAPNATPTTWAAASSLQCEGTVTGAPLSTCDALPPKK